MTNIFVFLAVLALPLVYIISVYNRLVSLKNRFKNSFAQIDVQLQRRYDLIPNLVEAAKAYLTHEQSTLEAVMAARNQAKSASKQAAQAPDNGDAIDSLAQAESALAGSLANFYAVSENYPELKANETISELMEELTSTENRVSFSRQAFNDSVMEYNTYREQFPHNFVRGFGDFKEARAFKVWDQAIKKTVKVSFP